MPRSRPTRSGQVQGRGSGGPVEVVWHRHLQVDKRRIAEAVGRKGVEGLKENASKGQRGDDKQAPPLTADYARRKARKGGSPRPDFRLTGRLLDSLRVWVVKVTRRGFEVVFGASEDQGPKLRGLAKHDRNLMALSSSDAKELAREIERSKPLKSVRGPPRSR